MCKAITDLEKKYQEIGEKSGADKALTSAIRNLMKTSQKTFEEACAMLLIPSSDVQKYKKLI